MKTSISTKGDERIITDLLEREWKREDLSKFLRANFEFYFNSKEDSRSKKEGILREYYHYNPNPNILVLIEFNKNTKNIKRSMIISYNYDNLDDIKFLLITYGLE